MVRALLVSCWLLTFGGMAVAGSADPASLVVSPEQVAKARDLVRLLGSDFYRDRDTATRELEAMGRLALPALIEARYHPDPEVQSRVAWLYPLAVSDELQERIATFQLDAQNKYQHDLPGWSWFRLVVGDELSTRDLFVEVLKNKANHDVLLALGSVHPDKTPGLSALVGGSATVGAYRPTGLALFHAITNRRQQLQFQMMPPFPHRPNAQAVAPKLPDLALLLLAESIAIERDGFVNNGTQLQLSNYLLVPPSREALDGKGTNGAAFRKLVVHWMDTRESVVGISNAMNIAQATGMGTPVVSKYAAKMMLSPQAHWFNRAQAATTLAKNNSKEHLFTITKLFTDEASVSRGNIANPQPDINVQDVALAMAVILSGQATKDYGFDEQTPGHAAMKYVYTNFYFRKDEAADTETRRAAAFAKWREWETNIVGSVTGPAIMAATMEQKYAVKEKAKK